ncbi:MAG: transposase, partial [Verrucomicrobiales bacterium]
MARFKPYDYDQSVMIPLCLEDQLQPGTFEHAVHHLIEERFDPDLFDGLYDNEEHGARAYPPQMLLKLILFGYSRGLNSSRKLERACREQIIFMALAAGHAPDHSTFAGFVTKVGGHLPEIFATILLVCEEEGLLGSTHFSLDGLKLPANASKSASGKFADLEHKRDKLRLKAKVLIAEHKSADDGGGDDPGRHRKRDPEQHHRPRQHQDEDRPRYHPGLQRPGHGRLRPPGDR